MNRLAFAIPLPPEAQQISNHLMDAEGTCTCGRVMRKLDAKLVLMTAIPSKGQLVAAAYCLMCSRTINHTLTSLKNTHYTGIETAPVIRTVRDIG